MRDFRVTGLVIAIYIYIGGFFGNFMVTGLYSGRVSDFFIKSGPDPDPVRVLKKNPYLTLFLIGPGKIRPIRVGSDRVSAGQAKIAIPTNKLEELKIL